MNVLDLFSGIGGFSVGLERASMRTVAFCESDEYCRLVLRARFPGVPVFTDVRELRGTDIASAVDLVCGGFPCQDISIAGAGAGIDGARSGLWGEFARLVGEVRPRFVLVENVAALLGRGFERVLGDLAALGFDAQWHCIPASYVGARHQRDRIWIVAHAQRSRLEIGPRFASHIREELAAIERGGAGDGWWAAEPDVGRVAYGVPARVDRLRALGNAVVPQVVEAIGRAIMRAA